MRGRPCFEVEFSDGAVITADAEHQWRTTTRASPRQPESRTGWYGPVGPEAQASRPMNEARTARHQDVVTTAQIAATAGCASADRRPNHAVAVAQAAALPARQLPLPPYTLGAWLGAGAAGTANLNSADPEIIAEIEAEGFLVVKSPPAYLRYSIRLPDPPPIPERSCRTHHGSVPTLLRRIGVLSDKHIPAEYLRSSEDQRRALLAGLLDTDGYAMKDGIVQFSVTSRRLAADAMELVLSLGYRASTTAKRVRGRTTESPTAYTVIFTPTDKVFRLTRKLARQTIKDDAAVRTRFITDLRAVPSVPVRCVQVDNADHMYLASRSWIPTHNSTLALDLARACSIKHGLTAAIFSLEMSRNEITMRLLSAEARVPLHSMRTGQLGDEDWTRLARRMSEVVDAPLFIDDSPNLSMMEIRAKCRRMKQRNDLRLVIIDYLQLMSSPKRVENRQQEVSDLSRSLKLLAKELEVPVIAVAQLNRGPEQRTDKRPLLADLRESGSIEQDSDVVILLHREDAYERESPRAGEADFIVAKHRNGPTATVTVAFQGHYSRFVDMAPV
jgi:replicative DNA helicase